MVFSMRIFLPHTHTSGSNLTVLNSTSGTSAVTELITFAALSWGSVVSFAFIGFLLSILTCKQFLLNNVTLKICLECFSQVIDFGFLFHL